MIRSMQLRLQLWYGSVLTLTLLLFGSLVYWRADRDLRDRAVRQAVTAAEYLAVSLRPPRPQPGFPGGPDGRPPRGYGNGPRPGEGGPPPRRIAPEPPVPTDLIEPGGPVGPIDPGGPGDPGRPGGRRGQPRIPPGPLLPGSLLGDPPPESVFESDQPLPPRPPADRLNYAIWHPSAAEPLLGGAGSAVLSGQPRPAPGPPLEVRREAASVQVIRRAGALLILVDRPLTEDLAELHLFGASIGILGTAALVISLVGGRWVSARMVRPIAVIAEAAREISVTQLDRRIETQLLDRELIPLAAVLNSAFARLEQSFRRLSQFTADASHELRTPLAVIQSQAELALLQPRSPAEYRGALETCLKSANRMRSLTDSLLLLARSDSGRLPQPAENSDLRPIVEDAAAALQERFSAAGVELDCETPEQPLLISAAPGFLRQIPLNLLDNALQHTPSGGRVTVQLQETNGKALLIVTDTGCGIAAEHLPHIFDRFYRVDTARSRRTGGSGLGLAICRSLAEAHGGQIECESIPGKGTTITVQLPLAAAESASAVPRPVILLDGPAASRSSTAESEHLQWSAETNGDKS